LNVISVSLRGWGDSRDNGPSPSIATYAADVSFLLDSLKVTKASVVGYEMGGAVALQLAQADKRIQTVSFIDASGRPVHPLGVEAVERELASWKAGPNEEFLTTFLGLDSLTQQKLISRSYAEGLLANACKPNCDTYLPGRCCIVTIYFCCTFDLADNTLCGVNTNPSHLYEHSISICLSVLAWRSYCEYDVVGAVKGLTIPLQFIWCGAVSEDDKSNSNMRVPVTVQNSFIRSINLRDPSQIDFTTSGELRLFISSAYLRL
jgi:pimeloyl-ACP methyl ester carboxylesterase